MDVLVKNNTNNSLEFSIFCQKTNSNYYIHYFSCHDDNVKYATISSMFLRAYRVCDPQYLDTEINTIYNVFSELSYPKWFIDVAHRKARKTYFKINATSEENKEKKCIVVPFNQNLKFLNFFFKESTYKLVFNNPGTIGKTLINNKTKLNKEAGVYQIPCKDITCGRSYFGETGRSLNIRINEHKNEIRKGNDLNALFHHMESTNHAIDFQKKELLFCSEDYIERRIVESCLIDSRSNFNISSGHFKINKFLNKVILKDVDKKIAKTVN